MVQHSATQPRTKILIAEDSPTQAQRLRHILEIQGYDVAVAAHGREALEIAQRVRPAVIVSDVVMPEMDGYELSTAIKADSNLRDIPVILVTTMSDPEDVIRGLECGADNFVLKPYEPQYLLSRVRYAILNREVRRPHDAGIGVEIYFSGERHFITADRLQILNLLLSTYDAAMQRNKELQRSQEELAGTNSRLNELKLELEERVRQRTEELQRSEQRFRYAAQATQEVIWDWDLARRRMTYNDALRDVWGHELPTEEVDVRWYEERIHPEDRDRIMNSIWEAVANADRWSGEYRFQRANGMYGHVIGRAVIIRDDSGKAQRKIGTMLDVTQERIAVERVQESELLFRSVAETAGDAIVLSDVRGDIVFWNRGAARMFGYEADEIVGKPITVLMPERHRDRYKSVIDEFRETGQAGRVLEFDGVRQDEREFPLEMSLTVWKSRGETFFTAVIRDVSHRVGIDRRQRIQFAVVRTLSEVTAIANLPAQLLQNVATELGWQAAFWWEHEKERRQLRCTHGWSDPDVDCERLLSLTREATLSTNDGFPAPVAITAHATASSLGNHSDSPRAAAAREAGIPHSVAFPILESGKVTAVVEFLKARATVDDEDLLDLLTDIGRRVGEFFERRRAEERLVESEASLAEAQQLAKLASFAWDLRTPLLGWSAQVHRLFGMKPGEFEGTVRGYLARVHPDDRARVKRLVTPPLSDASLAFRHRIVWPDGQIRWLQCRIQVVNGTLESPQTILGTMQDVSDEVASEETIRRLSNQNEMILNSAAEGILGIDASGRVMFANPAAAALTGWSIEELKSSGRIHDLIHPSCAKRSVSEEQCPLEAVMEDGNPRSSESLFSRKSGETFPVRFNTSAIFDDGRITGTVWIFEDITRRKRLENDLERANRVSGLGRVAATIAHEFNNVLMGIQPFAESIRRRNEDEQTRKSASQIINSVARGKRVTQEILRFTQPSIPDLQPIELGAWFHQLLPELQNLVGASVDIQVDFPRHPVIVLGDPAQLQQVITNLVLNARDAIDAKGTVAIAVRDGGTAHSLQSADAPATTVISVRDTGRGIPADVLQNIFEPLFTTKRTGTGLGLAVAQQVISAHGGSIEVESTPGQGTTFHLVLPAAEKKPAADPANRGQAASHVRRVLVVEDETDVAAGLVLLLESEGIRTQAVETGREALEVIKTLEPDAVILDMSLPDMHGHEVYKEIAACYPSLPVLFSSGHIDESNIDFAQGKVAFLRKPYEFDALMAALQSITHRDKGGQ